MKTRPIIFHAVGYTLVAALGFFAGVTVVASQSRKAKNDEFQQKSQLWGKAAPAIDATTLTGNPWKLSDLRGKVVVLDFWASWCPGCPNSMQRLKPIFEEFGRRDDFALVGISLDNEAAAAQKFCEQNGVTWEQLIEPKAGWNNSVAKAFGVSAVPSIRIVDRAGRIRVIDGDVLDLRWVVKEMIQNPDGPTWYVR
jgi:peroxiredoxin